MRILTLQEVEAINGGSAIQATEIKPIVPTSLLGDVADVPASAKSTVPVADVSGLAKKSSNSSQVCTPAHQTASWDGHSLKVKDYPGYCVGGDAH